MQEENNMNNGVGEEKEIDFAELAAKLWAHRKTALKWCIWGVVIGLVVAFSIPREYTSGVKLAPEISNNKSSGGGLASLASMVGVNLTSANITDAVYPQLYPDVVSSVPFITGLFDVEVETKKEHKKMTLQQYMDEETSSPWWSVILRLPGKAIGAVMSIFRDDDDEGGEGHVLNTFQLTKDENELVESLNKRISASVDQKTFVISISVKMQDPRVAAMLADTVASRLQEFVTEYRTNKARNDLEHAELLNEEAQEGYFMAQQRLADYLDRNQGLSLYSAQTTRDRLQNEATLAFNLYNQTAQQVQLAEAKVQENTPVYAVISPATVPLKPSGPGRLMMLIGFTFLAFAIYAGWLLFLQPMYAEYKEKLNTAKIDSKE